LFGSLCPIVRAIHPRHDQVKSPFVTMSRTNNTHYAMWMGVTALAATAASMYYYYYVANQSPTMSSKKKKWLDNDDTSKKDPQDHSDDITVKSKGRSFDGGGGGGTDQHRTAGTASSTTIRTDDNDNDPSSILQMDETTLHARIEELDKKGKAYFKNKQVRGRPLVVCAGNCHHRPLVIEITIFCRLISYGC
jgi:hypothetical protein